MVVYLIKGLLPELGMEFSGFLTSSIILGSMLIAAAFTRNYYWRGSKERLVAGVGGVALTVIWILLVLGRFDIRSTFETFSFHLDATRLFLIIAAGTSLKSIHYLAEYKVFSRELEMEEVRRRRENMASVYMDNENHPIPPPPPDYVTPETAKKHGDSGIIFHPPPEDTRKPNNGLQWRKPGDGMAIKPHTGKREHNKR